jgi:hypothetical protein
VCPSNKKCSSNSGTRNTICFQTIDHVDIFGSSETLAIVLEDDVGLLSALEMRHGIHYYMVKQ